MWPSYPEDREPAAVIERRQTARQVIERAAAAAAVSSGPPTGWRLCQIVTAVDLFEQGWFDLAIEQARRAELPREAIPDDEAAISCPLPFGAVQDLVRQLGRSTARQARRWFMETMALLDQRSEPAPYAVAATLATPWPDFAASAACAAARRAIGTR